MNVTEYFLKNGKINASKSKALKLIEKVWPNLNFNSHIRSSMFINNVFDKIEKKNFNQAMHYEDQFLNT